VLLYNKCEWFRNGVNAIVDSVKEKVGAAIDFVKGIFQGIGSAIGSVMDAAKATVSEKLDNMRSAYEAHGGGIQGAAAAAMEGVKGFYTAGFTFLDNLTGGKLTAIKDKFVSGVTNIAQGVGERFTAVKTAFSNGIDNIKTTVSNAVTWFFTSGQRVVQTFANGISNAFHSAVDAVKGGLQKIRNMLPFSDAKEGPLSTLTLSGQRTMTTYAHGLTLAQQAPAEAMEQGLKRTKATLEREPIQKANIGGAGSRDDTDAEDSTGRSSGSGKNVIIQKLLMQVDLKKIKDLQQLLALLKEVEDYWDEKPEQKKVYTFERGVNILGLNRAGGVWELETVSAPFVKHSHKINVIHPQVSGEFEVSKVVSATNDSGFIRTYIYF
jgi:phage-related protein